MTTDSREASALRPGIHPCEDRRCNPGALEVMLPADVAQRTSPFHHNATFDFRRCSVCAMGFVYPTPSPAQLDAIYAQGYAYHGDRGDQPSLDARAAKVRIARWRHATAIHSGPARMLRSVAGRLVELASRRTVTYTLGVPLQFDPQARLLDFGYGTGLWLLMMRDLGYRDLWGFDLAVNHESRSRLRNRGIHAVDELEDIPTASVDLVRLEHCFEHLPDPVPTLAELATRLKPNGWLVMTFPSIYPWAAIENLPGSNYLGYMQLPIHVAHHSLQSARQTVGEAGFEVLGQRVTKGERFITLLARRRAI